MQKIPLEDNFTDVIGKVQRGLGISDDQLAARAGISTSLLAQLKEGQVDEAGLRKIAGPLKLKADALIELAKKGWYPTDRSSTPGLASFNTPYGDMTVNSYLVWDPKTSQAACFDTGADSRPMLKLAGEKKLRVHSILLTHTHPDHIADLETLRTATQAKAFVSKLEPIDGAETFEPGHKFTVGTLQIETRLTSGHSRGGITYVIKGLPQPIAVVGDAMFAASMGGGGVSYSDALKNNCEKILTLSGDTILCPGHGPLTTVGEEKVHNPFFPEI